MSGVRSRVRAAIPLLVLCAVAVLAACRAPSDPPHPAPPAVARAGAEEPCVIQFAGLTFEESRSGRGPVGPYRWDCGNAWVDADGLLHLRLRRDASGAWTGAELRSTTLHGFGTYTVQVVTPLADLPPSAVFAFFSYLGPSGTHEIDVEFARFGDPRGDNLFYVVYGAAPAKTESTFLLSAPLAGETTHGFRWHPRHVTFASVPGRASPRQIERRTGAFAAWRATDDGAGSIPRAPMPLMLNLWVHRSAEADPGLMDREVEVVIRAITCPPAAGPADTVRL